MEPMHVLVIGASGRTGRHLVKKLVGEGHIVTAFTRTADKVDPMHGQVKIIQGDGRSLADLSRAVRGQQAVLSAFGPRSRQPHGLQTVHMRHLVQAMREQGVSRLVSLSAWGVGDSANQAPPLLKLAWGTVLRRIGDDKQQGEAAIIASSLNYTLVRPGLLTDNPPRGGVRASLTKDHLTIRISRADVAGFMVDQLTATNWHRQAPLIGY